MMRQKQILIITLLIPIFLFFQNCSNDATLSKLEANSSNLIAIDNEIPINDSSNAPDLLIVDNDEIESNKDVFLDEEISMDDKGDELIEKEDSFLDSKESEEDIDNEKHLANYICILNHNGRSVRLGSENNNLEQKRTPKTICMTKDFCENVVSKKVDVLLAKYAVQCEKNIAHVTHLLEGDLIDLLNKL